MAGIPRLAPFDPDAASLQIVIDGGGAEIAEGMVPMAGVVIPGVYEIVGWTLLGDQSGNLVVEIWKDTYANYPPTDADKITASDPPAIVGGVKAQDNALSGWTVALAAGDILRFAVAVAADIEFATLVLHLQRK